METTSHAELPGAAICPQCGSPAQSRVIDYFGMCDCCERRQQDMLQLISQALADHALEREEARA